MNDDFIQQCMLELQLPSDFQAVVESYYQPIAQDFAEICASSPQMVVFGIQGTQGSGKSTMANFLALMLEKQHNLKIANLSIDDFYCTASQRQQLADKIHPLLQTRGVPGTHDLDLALSTFNALKDLKQNQHCKLPRFDKAIDTRADKNQWDEIAGPVDAIIFEGWCVGAQVMSESSLLEPCNMLEAQEDAQGIWRNYINDQLKNTYPTLFDLIDYQLVISTDSFDNVYQWRLLQEKKLAKKWAQDNPGKTNKIIDEIALKRFIAHYERLTKHCLETLPQQATWHLCIDKNHTIKSLSSNFKASTE